MNSRQRRIDRRCWKYSKKVVCETWDEYNDMWQWLAKRHGKKVYKCGWREKTEWPYTWSDQIYVLWEFRREKDLMEFILRWS
jgi:hypothetical protein